MVTEYIQWVMMVWFLNLINSNHPKIIIHFWPDQSQNYLLHIFCCIYLCFIAAVFTFIVVINLKSKKIAGTKCDLFLLFQRKLQFFLFIMQEGMNVKTKWCMHVRYQSWKVLLYRILFFGISKYDYNNFSSNDIRARNIDTERNYI